MRSLFILILAIITVGCTTRGPNSRFMPAPNDPELNEIRDSLDFLLRTPEIQMPEPTDYFIGPGDVISIALVGRPDVLGVESMPAQKLTLTVTENPLINLPYIGAIKVHGKTAEELRETLKKAFGQYINEPQPVVIIEEFNYNRIDVLGSVKNAGRYRLKPGMTLLDGVFAAGGLTFGRDTGGPPPARFLKVYRVKLGVRDRADLAPEQLLDKVREGDHILPRTEIVIPIEEFLSQGTLEYNIPLRPNDIVYIPSAGTVSIVGKVKTTGVTFLGPSLRTLSQVVMERGGIRYEAASRVEIIRSLPDGQPESHFANIRRILRREEPDFLLRDGDQIYVYTNKGRDIVGALTGIFRTTVASGVNATYNPVGP